MKKLVGIGMVILSAAIGALLSGCAHDRTGHVHEPVPFSGVIETRLQRLFAADPLLKGHDIKVNTFQGEVKLDGVVETEEQRQQATKLAWGVAGVRGVENNLLLQSERMRSSNGAKSSR